MRSGTFFFQSARYCPGLFLSVFLFQSASDSTGFVTIGIGFPSRRFLLALSPDVKPCPFFMFFRGRCDVRCSASKMLNLHFILNQSILVPHGMICNPAVHPVSAASRLQCRFTIPLSHSLAAAIAPRRRGKVCSASIQPARQGKLRNGAGCGLRAREACPPFSPRELQCRVR